MTTIFDNQIQNRNFLSPIGFRFSLSKSPKINFFCNYARIPEISLGTALQTNYFRDLDIPGEKLSYGDFSLRFLIDENLENYLEVHNWLRGLGFPENFDEFSSLNKNQYGLVNEANQFSDGTMHILNSNYNTVAKVEFKDLFPISLSSLDFEATVGEVDYLTAEVTFKYTIYNIETV